MLPLIMVIVLCLFFFLLNPSPSQGVDEFTTNQEINYQFNELGRADVEHKISITNNFSQFYPKEYNLLLSNSQATDIQAYDSNGIIPIDVVNTNDEIKLSLKLQNSKTGKDQTTQVNIRYHSQSLAKQKGKTWEISLPQFQDKISNNISVSLITPVSFGKLSSSPPGATISTDSQNTKIVFKKYLSKEKLVVTFGEYQLFNFNLKYHITNTTNQKNSYTIPLPPDTANQKIFLTKIEPSPQKIDTDSDGNWLAYYQISPQSNIDIVVNGQAKIGHNPNYQFVSHPIFDRQLYWPIDNPEIIKLAKKYNTPRLIYEYVISSLSYDFNRINSSSRQGAQIALQKPESSLCTDFTDLFISIARAANIGAREIEGYAYSNNINIKPLSLGTDILHAWPEYYNDITQKWIPIDPTWGKTTGGINYFDNLDLNHLTFVIHNTKSDSPPPPGSYKAEPNQKSVDITFAESELILDPKNPIIRLTFNPFSKSYLTIKNPNLFTLDKFIIQNSSPINILPLREVSVNFPKDSFYSSLKTIKQKNIVNYSFNDLPPQTITIQNPYHFFNLFIVIIGSLILLSFGAIILLRHK